MNGAVNPNPALVEPPPPNPGSPTLPYRRVGTLLRAARTQAGYSPRAVARATGFPKQLLAAWEHGEVGVGDDNLAKLAVLYQVSLESLAPARRGITIDRDTETLRVGHHTEPLPKSITEPGEILERYLHLLYSLRGLKPNDQVHLRDDDLNNLADILGNTPREIERRLIDLMGISRKEATRLRRIILRRHVLTPAAGLALGAGLFGGFQALDNNAGSVEKPSRDRAHHWRSRDAPRRNRLYRRSGGPDDTSSTTGCGADNALDVDRTRTAAPAFRFARCLDDNSDGLAPQHPDYHRRSRRRRATTDA